MPHLTTRCEVDSVRGWVQCVGLNFSACGGFTLNTLEVVLCGGQSVVELSVPVAVVVVVL